jgi:hypothetical protein
VDPLLLKENQAICGRERRPVYEAIKPRGPKAESGDGFSARVPEEWKWRDITPEAAQRIIEGAKKTKTYRAKVSHADKVNQNRRIYPEAVWQDQIDRFTPQVLDNGSLAGAVDHPSYFEGGSLKNTCIIWRTLEMEATAACSPSS